MAFVYADRVKETSTTVGTGSFVLSGAVSGFQTFSAGVGSSNETYYSVINDSTGEWEVGQGTVSVGSLSRDSIIASSNSNLIVSFSAGLKTIDAVAPSAFFDAALNTTTHAAINHTGLPGIPAAEAFTSAAHDGVDHTAGPFNLLDATNHNAIDHTAGPLNLLDEPAHDALDHTGLTGINSFDAAAHSAVDHTGLTGIPVVDGETESVATQASGLTISRVIPGGTLAVDGESLEFTIWASTTSGSTSVSWGGQVIHSDSTTGDIVIRGTIIRTGASAQEVFADFTAPSLGSRLAGTQTLASNVTLSASVASGVLRAIVVRKWGA